MMIKRIWQRICCKIFFLSVLLGGLILLLIGLVSAYLFIYVPEEIFNLGAVE